MRYLTSLFLIFLFSRLASALEFSDSCAAGDRIVIAAVGDVLLHRPLQERASVAGFESLWDKALPFLQAADIAYANLEGPIASGIDYRQREVRNPAAWDFAVYSTYPLFNYHPSLAQALKRSGFDIVSNANNHALDRGSIGIDKTLDALEAVSLLHIGTTKKGVELPDYQIVEAKGVRVAWISCTEHTNGNTDKFKQVRHCYTEPDRTRIVDVINDLKSKVDAIIISPHWGDEYHAKPNRTQIAFAKTWLDAGATAVIGAHPHVLQPTERYTTKDGRETVISYSLGNFVSNQSKLATQVTMILFVGLTKTNRKTRINGIRFLPMQMKNRGTDTPHLRASELDPTALNIVFDAIEKGRMLSALPLITNPECGN